MSQYRIGARLGIGGMAEVFAGEAIGTEAFARPVAIKRILPAHASDPQFAALFAAEAQITSRLRHPNIVETLDFYREDDGGLVLVMELVRGVNLSALAEGAPLPPAAIAFVIAELLRGLGHAHAQRLVHRDVSPHNVLLSWEGAVKVSDFGIAKARDATQATASVLLKGKPAYMSPEQANAQPLDGRSDLFAVGVILWELLAHRSLFKADDTRATLAAVLFGTVPNPRTSDRKASPELCRIAMRLLERDRDKRYATADEAIAELSKAYPVKEDGRQQLITQMAERFLGERPIQPTVSPRRGFFFALATAFVLALVGVSVGVSLQRDDSTLPSRSEVRLPEPPSVPNDGGTSRPIPFAKAGAAWKPIVEIRLPADAAGSCVEEIELLTRMIRCGRMPSDDRASFENLRETLGRSLSTIPREDQAGLIRSCKEDVAVLQDLKVSYFVDCKLSMGDGG